MPETPNIKRFAEQVERLCDFLVDRISEETGRNGSEDLKIIEQIREDAANLQFKGSGIASETIHGLADYISGIHIPPTNEQVKET